MNSGVALRPTWLCLLIGFGVQVAIALTLSIVQAFTLLIGFHATSISAGAVPAICLLGIPFNAGGLTVRGVFEVLVPHRSDIVMSHLPAYLPLLLLQVCVVAVAFGLRLRWRGKVSDPWLAALATFLILNGAANLWWPWWGT